MKKAFLVLVFFTACATKPQLKAGSCYELALPDSGRSEIVHVLMNFKVIEVFDYKNKQYYAIQDLDSTIDQSTFTVQDSSIQYNYGVANVEEFDKYISPVLAQYTNIYSSHAAVQCDDSRSDDQ